LRQVSLAEAYQWMLYLKIKMVSNYGVRYRNNSLLVNSQDTQTFHSFFVDVQTNVNYQASGRWQWSFLGNISQNKYDYAPLTRVTKFNYR
jgi:hypothetical protein